MTQEEKAKRYDEALEELRGLLEGIREEKCKILEEDITSIFPELKENEDERIRKGLIKAFGSIGKKEWGGVNVKDVIAWLEKQGEQKLAWSEEDEVMLDEIIDFFENGTVKLQHDLSLYASWLKSLKDRYAWRASWEQLDALLYVCRNLNPPLADKLGWDSLKTLELLYQDLKKL